MHYPKKFDKVIAGGIAKLPRRSYPLMKYASITGGSVYAISVLLLVISFAVITNRSSLLTFSLMVALFTPLAELLKFITRRPRPETLYVEKMRFKSFSFPSGHAYVSALMGGFLATLFLLHVPFPLSWLLVLTAALFSLIVGVSRVYLGAHFPSDVAAGWILGVIVLLTIRNAVPV